MKYIWEEINYAEYILSYIERRILNIELMKLGSHFDHRVVQWAYNPHSEQPFTPGDISVMLVELLLNQEIK